MNTRLFSWLLLILLFCSTAHAGEKTVVLASLDWPPYSGQKIFRNGASSEVIRAAFKAVGYDVEIRYFPWKRAIQEALVNPDVDGVFPEYHNFEREKWFLFSKSIGKSPLGLAAHVERSFHWDEMKDLIGLKIGVVSGYVNTEEFDAMMAAGILQVESSVSDVINLRKLLGRRVDLSVVDPNVLEYYLHNDPMLRKRKSELETVSQLLDIHDLHVCFKKGEDGDKLLRLFNQGLGQVHSMRIQREYIESISVWE